MSNKRCERLDSNPFLTILKVTARSTVPLPLSVMVKCMAATVAQMIQQLLPKQEVRGSNPVIDNLQSQLKQFSSLHGSKFVIYYRRAFVDKIGQ